MRTRTGPPNTKGTNWGYYKIAKYRDAGIQIHEMEHAGATQRTTKYRISRLCHERKDGEFEVMTHEQVRDKIRRRSPNCNRCAALASHATRKARQAANADKREAASRRVYNTVLTEKPSRAPQKPTERTGLVLWLMATNRQGAEGRA